MSISNYTQEVQLPSLGYLNPEIPEGKIIQRCMMVTDQKFLASSNLSPEETTRELLRRTTEQPANIDISKLTTADTLFLLFKLRILSYGDTYKYRARCPECGSKFEVTINLSELLVNTLPENYEDKLKVELPVAGDTVYTRFLTSRDLTEIQKEVDRRRRRNPEDDSEFILRLAAGIRKIELKSPNANGMSVLEHPVDIQRYLESLTDLDATAIRATTDSVAYGIQPTIEYKCPNCRDYIDLSVSFGAGFFRPKYDL